MDSPVSPRPSTSTNLSDQIFKPFPSIQAGRLKTQDSVHHQLPTYDYIHRNVNVANPINTNSIVMIQKRTLASGVAVTFAAPT
jgi:hypothetical protein